MKKTRLFILLYLFTIILNDLNFSRVLDPDLSVNFKLTSLISILLATSYLIYFYYRLKGQFSLDIFSKIFITYFFLKPIFDFYLDFGSVEFFQGWSDLIFKLPLIFYLFFPNKLQRLTFLTFGFTFFFSIINSVLALPNILNFPTGPFNISIPLTIINTISYFVICFEFLSYLNKKLTQSPFVRLGDLFLITIVSPLFYFIFIWLNIEDQELYNLLTYKGEGLLAYTILHSVCLIIFFTISLKKLSIQFKSIPSEIVVNRVKVIDGGKNLILYSYSIFISVLASIAMTVILNNIKSLDTLESITKIYSVFQFILSIAIICFLLLATFKFLTSDKIENNSQQLFELNSLGRISNLLKQLFWLFIAFSVLIFSFLNLINGLFQGEPRFDLKAFGSLGMTIIFVLLLINIIFSTIKLYQIGKICREIEKNTDE